MSHANNFGFGQLMSHLLFCTFFLFIADRGCFRRPLCTNQDQSEWKHISQNISLYTKLITPDGDILKPQLLLIIIKISHLNYHSYLLIFPCFQGRHTKGLFPATPNCTNWHFFITRYIPIPDQKATLCHNRVDCRTCRGVLFPVLPLLFASSP